MDDHTYETTAEHLRTTASDNITVETITQALATGHLITTITEDDDPFTHPHTYRAATPQQQTAIRNLANAFTAYIRVADINDLAVEAAHNLPTAA